MLKFVSRLLSLSFLLFLVSSLVYPVFATEKETVSITVVGKGSLEDSTREKAEKIALKNAFQRTIEQGLGTFVKSDTEIADFDLVKDKFISKSERYIRSYAILRQWDDDDGKTLNVKIKAVVSLKQIGEDFKSMVQNDAFRIGNPVIAFVLTAWLAPEATGQRQHLEGQILIDSFQEQFKNKGFEIKAAADAREFANTGTGKLAQVVSGGREKILEYARKENISFVVRGEITTTFGGMDPATGTYIWTGTISGEIVDVDNNEIFGSYSVTVTKQFPNKVHGLNALMHSAANNAARKFAEHILDTWTKRAGSGRKYDVFVSGYKNYAQKRKIKKAFNSFHVTGRFTETETEMHYPITYKGSSRQLEDKLAEAIEQNGVQLQNVIIDGSKVTIKCGQN